MSFPFVVVTDWAKWFEKACPKCRKLVLEFIMKECSEDLKAVSYTHLTLPTN